jgi:hypothetical protein
VDPLLVLCLRDEQDPKLSIFASGERPGEEHGACLGKMVHERCVLLDPGLVVDASDCPSGTGLADNGEQAHARAIR